MAIPFAVIAVALAVVIAPFGSDRAANAHGHPLAMLEEDVNLLSNPTPTLQALRSVGVDVVRLSVAWRTIAPAAHSLTAPHNFNAVDPAAYAAASWAPYDTIVRDARADGIKLDFLLTGPAPLWATGRAPQPAERSAGTWDPSAEAYGRFVQAVATRYGGSYAPPGSSSPLPRVSFWEVWNEPNWGRSLQPQMALRPLRVVSAPEYRRLLDAGWSALRRTGHGQDTIVIGSLSPRGIAAPPNSALAAAVDVASPLGFTRTLFCVDQSYHPLRGDAASLAGCPTSASGSRRFRSEHPALFESTGYGIHPYPVNLPPTETDSTNPDTVEFSQIPHLAAVVDRIQRVYGSPRRIKIYNTEFGYITHPPNAGTEYLPPTVAARYLNWAEYLTWRDPQIATTMQYLLFDPSPGQSVFGPGGFATGLIFHNGRPKATFYAYRLPIFLPVTNASSGEALEVWGGVRPARYASVDTGRPQYVSIQFSHARGGPFRTLRTVRVTDTQGYFDVRVAFPRSGTVRLQWSYPRGDRRLRDPVTPEQTTIFSRDVQVTIS